MRTKLKEKGKKLLTIAMSCLMLFGMLPGAGMQAFAENGGNKLSTTDISSYSLDIVDNAHDNAKIDYKKHGDSGYSDYLNDPTKFTQPVGKDQKESELSLKFTFSYKGTIKDGDTLEIPASLGDEFNTYQLFNVGLRDGSGNDLGTYAYSQGKFVLTFSGEHIKKNEVKNPSLTLNAGPVKIPNTKLGTGTNGEKAVIHGKVLGSNIIAGYEKKNKDNPTAPGALSLDNVTIKSFKIIDVANGNKEIDYRTSNQAEYDTFKNEPSKFSNALHEGQKDSKVKLNLSLEYKSDKVIVEGDTLTIPATYGGFLENFSSLPLKDGANNVLGTWEYKDGKIQVKFSGDYIKNQQVKQFTASFETGEMNNYNGDQKRGFQLGERYAGFGKLGKNDLSIAIEKCFVKTKIIGTTHEGVKKASNPGNDSHINWEFQLVNDEFYDNKEHKSYPNAYMLEHDGAYNPNSRTEIYIEDTFSGGIGSPKLNYVVLGIGGINDEGKVVSARSKIWLPSSVIVKKEQGIQTREQVKTSLKNGEYCIYDNKDGTYTFMLKWWDMNDSNGLTYNDIEAIKTAGGVGNWLKKNQSIYKDISSETVDKINKIYDGKALQLIDISIGYNYTPVKEITDVTNTAKIATKQTGEYESTAKSKLTPPAGIADAPADPLSVKLIKSDRKTGAALSKGFKFELQNTKDNGTTWTKVDVKQDMLEKGSLDNGQLVPDDKGIVQIKKLAVGKYRFVETAHPQGYENVAEDKANPNSTKNPKASNSKVIELDNQGAGEVVAMHNEPKGEKVEIKVNKKWVGPAKDSVTVKLLADGNEVPGKTLTLTKDKNWEGKFTDLDKLNKDGAEIKYDVAEVTIPGYESKKTGDVKSGFTITNKNVEKINIPVKKTWVGKKADKVRVRLLANGTEKAFKDLDEASNWQHTFSNYPKYDAQGKEITYTVKEDKIEGYKSDTEGDVKKGFTITNTNIEKVSIPVEKKWVGKAIDKVEIKLLAGTEVKDTVTLSKDNSWKHTFRDLPKYDKDGNKIKYDIEEVKVDGYITGKSGTAENGFTITNTITGKVSVPVTKTWVGKEGTSATINLLADGKKVDSVVLNKRNNWQHTFANLEKYKDGNEINYTVEEEKLPLYDITMEGNAKDGFILKNTHVPPMKKVFTGGTTTNIDGKAVKPGQELTYSITYKNTKGKKADVTITDKLPKHTTFVSADNDGKYENGMVKWTKKVADGDTWTVKFTVKVDKDVNGATLTNTARVNDGVNDSDTNTVKNPTPKTPDKPEPKKPHGPRTGDDSNISLLLMLLLASGGGLGAATYMRRKRQ